MKETKFEVYDRFDICRDTFNTRLEAETYIDGYEPEESYMMEIVEVNYLEVDRNIEEAYMLSNIEKMPQQITS